MLSIANTSFSINLNDSVILIYSKRKNRFSKSNETLILFPIS